RNVRDRNANIYQIELLLGPTRQVAADGGDEYNETMVLPPNNILISRRKLIASAAVGACAWSSGCLQSVMAESGTLERIWGLPGETPGRLNRPRAVAIDKSDLLYIVDMTPQIQVFTGDGVFVRGWQTPQFEHGRPSGLAFNHDGNLLVCDTHYF